MKTLFLIRHGETATNTKGVLHHVEDEARLTELGAKQAQRTAALIKSYGVNVVITSPEQRAVQTAECIAEAVGTQLMLDPDLCERNWGDWSGRPWAEIQAILSAMSVEERYDFIPPSGESWRQFDLRLHRFLKHVQSYNEDKTAAITHGGVLRALMPILKNEPKEDSFRYDFENASVTIFNIHSTTFDIEIENDTKHLKGLI